MTRLRDNEATADKGTTIVTGSVTSAGSGFDVQDWSKGSIDITVLGRGLLDRIARMGVLGLTLELPDTLVAAAWAGVLVSFVLTLLGPTFGLDDWVLGISPFWHVPNVSATGLDWSGLGWVTLVAALLIAIGFAGFRRRDLAR